MAAKDSKAPKVQQQMRDQFVGNFFQFGYRLWGRVESLFLNSFALCPFPTKA